MNPAIERELRGYLERLPVEEQLQVLGFARALSSHRTRGSVGLDLRRFSGAITKADLALMEQAIREGCEQVNIDEW